MNENNKGVRDEIRIKAADAATKSRQMKRVRCAAPLERRCPDRRARQAEASAQTRQTAAAACLTTEWQECDLLRLAWSTDDELPQSTRMALVTDRRCETPNRRRSSSGQSARIYANLPVLTRRSGQPGWRIC